MLHAEQIIGLYMNSCCKECQNSQSMNIPKKNPNMPLVLLPIPTHPKPTPKVELGPSQEIYAQ